MGEQRFVVCEDCWEYVDIQKVNFETLSRMWDDLDGDEPYVDRHEYWIRLMFAFLENHRHCHITWYGEYTDDFPPRAYNDVGSRAFPYHKYKEEKDD